MTEFLKSVKIFQGDKVINQYWEKGKDKCSLVEHTITDRNDLVNTKTTILFDKNIAKVEHEIDEAAGWGYLKLKGKEITDVQSKVDAAVAKKSGNVFETLANKSLKVSPNEPQIVLFSSAETQNQAIKKVFSGKAIDETKEAFCTMKTNAKMFRKKI